MKRYLILVGLVYVLVGCADTHKIIRQDVVKDFRITPNDKICISVPIDGLYRARVYKGSGENTSRIIYSEFMKRSRMVKLSAAFQEFEAVQEEAKSANCKYLVHSTILNWEDRATEWSSIPDKVEIKIEIIETLTSNTMLLTIIKGTSGVATLGGDHPQDLLLSPIGKFVSSLYF
ncbi:MAG: DUF4823 domain-containing protein [Gammaproteobacteria bacterium]|nr:DUF4823 domain-containing protein [Gammaproteobacteria bacterium]